MALAARQSRVQSFFQAWAILTTQKYLPRKTPCLPFATRKNLHCTSAVSPGGRPASPDGGLAAGSCSPDASLPVAAGDVPPAAPATKPPAAPGSESAAHPAIEPPAAPASDDDDQHSRKGRVETSFLLCA